MNGLQYENFCVKYLKLHGYHHIQKTKASHDQGIDIIATRHHIRYGIQCKYYATPISNKAIQEVYAGLAYYHLERAIVMTNSTFTTSAQTLAQQTGVLLWANIQPPSVWYKRLYWLIYLAIGIYMVSQDPNYLITIIGFPLIGFLLFSLKIYLPFLLIALSFACLQLPIFSPLFIVFALFLIYRHRIMEKQKNFLSQQEAQQEMIQQHLKNIETILQQKIILKSLDLQPHSISMKIIFQYPLQQSIQELENMYIKSFDEKCFIIKNNQNEWEFLFPC